MLNAIIGFSVKNKLVVGIFLLALIGYGVYNVTRLPIDAVPDITNNQVQVITVAPSFGATDIERLITFPIEQANSNIGGIKEIRSFSRFGLSLVTIVFNDDIDVYWARQQVAERLQKVQAEIPKGIGVPELGPISTGLGEIYQYVIHAKKGYEKKYDETKLRTIQDWIVRRQLLGVEGVAEVSSFGGKLKQYEIAVDPNKLQAYNINIKDVFSALEKNNQNTGGAYIEKGPSVLFIRTEGLVEDFEDIKNIAIKITSDGTPLFIRDIADVKLGYATRYGAMCYNDEGEVAGAIVMMLKGANSSEVVKNVKERVAQIQKTLPDGVIIEPFLDRTKMVNNAIGTVEKNLLEGALIVIFILVLFLGNIRAGFLVASVIPLSMLFAVSMMNLFGVSGNLMSLGALDFGLIVDGAVIIVEAVMHQLVHRKKAMGDVRITSEEMNTEVKSSAGKMMNSAVFGQIIILVVYLPIFTLQGIEGKMFKPMAETVAFALLGAFILSLTYVPMMSAWILGKGIKAGPTLSEKMMMGIENAYRNRLQKVLHHPKIILASIFTLFVLSIGTVFTLGGEFIPALEEGDFAVETRVLTGSNLNTTVDNTQKIVHILKTRFPEVEKIVTKIGSGEVPTDPMPMEAADMMIILKDKKEWTSATTFDELAEKMGNAAREVPGVTTGFQFPVQMRFNELMTGARQDVVCKIYGENLDSLAYYANVVGGICRTVDGTSALFVETVTGMPQIIIEYNRKALAEYGLTVEDVNKMVNASFAGQIAGAVYEGERKFELVVRLSNESRSDLTDIRNLLIPTEKGTQVPLYQLASVDIKEGPNQIQREDAKRRIIVGFNVHGRDVESIVNELKKKVEAKIKFPPGYYITYGGAFENLNAAKQRLMIAVPVSLLLIFLFLYFAFGSIRHGLLIYSAIPLSAIGGILFLWMRDMPFSISAGVGFIALFGISVLNGIVLIAEFNRLKNEDGGMSLTEIVVKGASLRLRPVLMTALVASFGFFPMAVSNGAGAEVQRPLATVVIGGLLIATLLTLFVLPILYIMFEQGSSRRNKSASVTGVILFLFVLNGGAGNAQTNISMQAAVDSALKNNLELKNSGLRSDAQKQLTKTAYSIAPTNASVQYGQVNSIYYDNLVSVGQNFNFPAVYTRSKDLLTEEWKTGVINGKLKQAEIKRMVQLLFIDIQALQAKEKLLVQSDSIYGDFVQRAKERLDKGESNSLEFMTAQNQKAEINIQLQQLRQNLQEAKLNFNFLLNTKTPYVPEEKVAELQMPLNMDTSSVMQHPWLLAAEQQRRVNFAAYKVEKAKLLPDINLSYYNMTMKGTGADNKFYTPSSRFQSVQLGLGIPLFYGAQRGRIQAGKINNMIANNDMELRKMELTSQYKAAFSRCESNKAAMVYYESTGIRNAESTFDFANKQFTSGEINYLEWVMLINQAISVKSGYLNSLRMYNESVIQLNYLISN